MRRSVWIKAALLFVAGCVVVNGAMARVQCERMGNLTELSMELNVQKLDVGPNVPIGSEVYSEEYSGRESSFGLTCVFDNKDEATYLLWSLTHDAGVGVVQGGKRVYKTSVDGLGVYFINSMTGKDIRNPENLKMSNDFYDAKSGGKCNVKAKCELFYKPRIKIVLVKTGSVKSGPIVDIPSVLVETEFGQRLFRLSIVSNASVVSKTCLVSPVQVNMGGHSTRVFTGIGSTAPSKDFSIELTNCPAFNRVGKNVLKFRIDPVLPALNASNGVLRLNASASTTGTRAASGVGIQIVTTKDSPLFLGQDQDSGLSLRSTEASYSIPLRARYLQTESKVTPGPAKAEAKFTIIYP